MIFIWIGLISAVVFLVIRFFFSQQMYARKNTLKVNFFIEVGEKFHFKINQATDTRFLTDSGVYRSYQLNCEGKINGYEIVLSIIPDEHYDNLYINIKNKNKFDQPLSITKGRKKSHIQDDIYKTQYNDFDQHFTILKSENNIPLLEKIISGETIEKLIFLAEDVDEIKITRSGIAITINNFYKQDFDFIQNRINNFVDFFDLINKR